MECGNCQACCILLDIEETDSSHNSLCKYQCDEGCSIYGKHPKECQLFNCCWKQMEKVGIALRPDICGVMFEKWTDNVIFGVTSKSLTDLVIGQIEAFNNENISVILFDHRDKTKTRFLAREHTREFVEKEIKNGTPKLY